MLLFVVNNVQEIIVVSGCEACIEEILLGHHADAALIEDILEMLEGEGVLKDVNIGNGLALDGMGNGRRGKEQGGYGSGEEFHGVN